MSTLVQDAASPGAARPRRTLWIRIAVSVAILGGLIYAIGLDTVLSSLALLDGRTLLLVLPVVFLQVILVTCRWCLIGKALGMAVPYRRMFEIQSLSGLIGTVLPTGIGSSALRIFLTYREGVPFAKAASSIVIDRVVATVILLIMVVAAQPLLLSWAGPIAGNTKFAWGLAAALLIAVVAGALLLPAITSRMTRVWSVLRALAADAQTFSSKAVVLTATLTVATFAQFPLFVVAFLLGNGLGIELSLIHYVILMPTVALLASLPVALGGWGVREGSLVAGLMLFQVPPEKSLLLGLTIGMVSLVALVPGALLCLLRRNHRGKPVLADANTAIDGLQQAR